LRCALSICLFAFALALGNAGLLPSRAAAASFGTPLQTAVDMYPPDGPESGIVLARVHALGARFIRLVVSWRVAAPISPAAGFDPANPYASGYRWKELDHLVEDAVAQGLEPIVDISSPPSWAQSPQGAGVEHPDPGQLGLFAHAAALRYDGTRGLPRVRYWEVWNEPNVGFFLQPQIEGGRYASVETYRAMVNAMAAGVHGVWADDVVIAGELFPNGIDHPDLTAIAPLDFTRRLLCLSKGPRPHRTCNAQVNADVWSVHPYTSGGPSTKPLNPDNVWIRNLSSLTSLVRSGQRLGALISTKPVQTWVTEFSWDTNPPDPHGVPARLEQRWVDEALYRSWSAGIGVFTWFSLRDLPFGSSMFQSGLYFACPAGAYCDTPKPAASAFHFPFVAFPRPKHRVLVWGRTPAGVPSLVSIQWRRGRRWATVARVYSDRDGIFTLRVRLPRKTSLRTGSLRALTPRLGASPSFGLYHPPDILVTPFGT
jgi:hypothetical protein